LKKDMLCWLSIAELAAGYRAQEFSPLDVTRSLLDRIKHLDDQINSYIAVLEDSALREARASENRFVKGASLGALDGVPVSLKDIFHIAGVPTTAASKILTDSVAGEDSAVVKKIRATGAVLLGKTNLHEFAYGITGLSSHFGPVRNPWDLEHITGGSSSGSAAAVAAGVSYASVGSETGASVRRPASFCGVVGFKPTYGFISRRGMLPGAWSIDTVGVFGRSVSDAVTFAGALVGYETSDPFSQLPGDSKRSMAKHEGMSGLRIGVPRMYLNEDVAEETRSTFEVALMNMEKQGARVSDFELPSVRFTAVTLTLVSASEISSYHRQWIHDRPDDYCTDVRDRLYLGLGISAGEYLLAQRARRRIGDELQEAFSKIDVLVTPTTPGPAPRIADGVTALKDRPLEVGYHHSNLVRLPSLLGLPVISVPSGQTRGGLPLALQIVGRPFDEVSVIRVAHAVERAAGFLERHPGLSVEGGGRHE